MNNEFKGKVYKCPNCGEILQSFSLICPSCGYEIRDEDIEVSFSNFIDELDYLDSKLADLPSGDIQGHIEMEKKICSFIRTYPLPDQKKDLYEFMIHAASNVDTSTISGILTTKYYKADPSVIEKYNNLPLLKRMYAAPPQLSVEDTSAKDRSNAWLAKVEQIYQKAQLSLKKSDPDYKMIEATYNQTISSVSKAKKKKKNKKRLIILAIIIALIVFVVYREMENRENVRMERELQQTVQQIHSDIRNNDFDAAREKIDTLYYFKDSSYEKRYWERQRNALTKEVDKAEKQYIKEHK